MSDIPDGANEDVAKIAIAWEITKRSIESTLSELKLKGDQLFEKYIEDFKRSYSQIYKIIASHGENKD